jgi:hypothetical protein
VALAAAPAAFGCGGGGGDERGGGAGGGGAPTEGDAGPRPDGGDAGVSDGGRSDGGLSDGGVADGAVEDAWAPLIGRTWQVDAHLESWECVTIKAPEDVWISAVRPDPGALTPGDDLQGTIYMLLSTADEWPKFDNWPETGEYTCDSSAFGNRALFASGIGTGDLELPEGTAMYIPAGKYVTLLMHVVNLGETPLEGESRLLVKAAAPVDPDHEVDMIFAGLLDNHTSPIPNDGQPFVLRSSCVFPTDWTVFAMWPHMRRLGTHFSVEHDLKDDGDIVTLVDVDYDFYDEPSNPQGEHLVRTNHEVIVDCTYVNDTEEAKYLASGITQEDCLVSLYKYPAGGTPYFCAFL